MTRAFVLSMMCILGAVSCSFFGENRWKIEGASMEPALCDGDTVSASDFDDSVDRWQLIVFRMPFDTSRTSLKRVVGLPGETLEIRDGVILIDGSAIEGDVYAKAAPNYEVPATNIPAERYFVLGDNRRNSYDSHAWRYASETEPDPVRAATVPNDLILGEFPADTKGCD